MNRQYSPIEKENMILEFKNSKLEMRHFVVPYNVTYQAFSKWVQQYDKFGSEGLSGTKKVEDQKIKELEKEIKKLKRANLELETRQELFRLLKREIDKKK
ncbi:transposase [Williamsoniiplasma lucivorax]|uniref:Transposase n=1 Tax=Williamsoniiplasma lucivorax TaxID=209274 RepID=A0A2S5RFK8_9MOLU|nr:transposase [Williamsoniiplasma lucivorax]PPE03948.1 hypothetical protein ELUCI_v1c09540 [Williamsoniiplasma lucivorax]PPE05304.1 hypothetical protein ELUCI_v1c06400 [Williamsoniiplasma lucivorax]PPE06093.1 hypothetical protein ELUCI_v1c03840 [Williamsoniiplasma lucivorax]